MEVLEHVVDLEETLDRLHSLLAMGTIVISVPVETRTSAAPETGCAHTGRLAGNRRLRLDQPLFFAEYAASMFAGAEQRVIRPVYLRLDTTSYHCHKGFNWRYLLPRVAERFSIRRVLGSRSPSCHRGFGSQVWIVAEKEA